jgi:hypothetical protein
VEDEDYFGEAGVVEVGLYDAIAVANVLGCVGEIALDEALEDVEEDAVSRGEGIDQSCGMRERV